MTITYGDLYEAYKNHGLTDQAIDAGEYFMHLSTPELEDCDPEEIKAMGNKIAIFPMFDLHGAIGSFIFDPDVQKVYITNIEDKRRTTVKGFGDEIILKDLQEEFPDYYSRLSGRVKTVKFCSMMHVLFQLTVAEYKLSK